MAALQWNGGNATGPWTTNNGLVKAALQLTPEQEKDWPAVENAIRIRAMDRQTRLAAIAERARELRDRSRIEVLRDRNPIEFMQRRADRLSHSRIDNRWTGEDCGGGVVFALPTTDSHSRLTGPRYPRSK